MLVSIDYKILIINLKILESMQTVLVPFNDESEDKFLEYFRDAIVTQRDEEDQIIN
jgi:hypothetical protein